MMRLLSAIILGGSLVIGASLMRPARYEEFTVDNTNARYLHGVFDNQTGEICYHIAFRDGQTRAGVELRPMVCTRHP